MILYQLIGLHYFHLTLVVNLWVGELHRLGGGFSGQKISLSDTMEKLLTDLPR